MNRNKFQAADDVQVEGFNIIESEVTYSPVSVPVATFYGKDYNVSDNEGVEAKDNQDDVSVSSTADDDLDDDSMGARDKPVNGSVSTTDDEKDNSPDIESVQNSIDARDNSVPVSTPDGTDYSPETGQAGGVHINLLNFKRVGHSDCEDDHISFENGVADGARPRDSCPGIKIDGKITKLTDVVQTGGSAFLTKDKRNNFKRETDEAVVNFEASRGEKDGSEVVLESRENGLNEKGKVGGTVEYAPDVRSANSSFSLFLTEDDISDESLVEEETNVNKATSQSVNVTASVGVSVDIDSPPNRIRTSAWSFNENSSTTSATVDNSNSDTVMVTNNSVTAEGKLLDNLLYSLNIISIRMPPKEF